MLSVTCAMCVNFDIPSDIVAICSEIFEISHRLCNNVFCKYL